MYNMTWKERTYDDYLNEGNNPPWKDPLCLTVDEYCYIAICETNLQKPMNFNVLLLLYVYRTSDAPVRNKTQYTDGLVGTDKGSAHLITGLRAVACL